MKQHVGLRSDASAPRLVHPWLVALSASACATFAALFEYGTHDVFGAEHASRDVPADSATSRSATLPNDGAGHEAARRELARLKRQVRLYAEALDELERTEAQLADGAYPEINREQVDEHRRQLTQAHARAVERLRAFEQTRAIPAACADTSASGRDSTPDDEP